MFKVRKKVTAFPVLELSCLVALQQGDYKGFIGYIRADLLDWIHRIKIWRRTP